MTIPMKQYLAMPGLSSSALGYFEQSPAVGKAYLDGDIKFEGAHLDFGTAVHRYLEDQDAFDEEYIVKPSHLKFNTKEGRAWKEGVNKEIVTQEQMWCIETLASRLQDSDDLLLKVIRESPHKDEDTFVWKERDLLMKCRADRWVEVTNPDDEVELHQRWPELFDGSVSIVADYKTTSKPINPRSFGWSVRDYRYDLKAAHYLFGTNATAFLWVVLETNPPYQVTRYLMSPNTHRLAEARRQQVIDTILECQITGEYPGLTLTDEETLL